MSVLLLYSTVLLSVLYYCIVLLSNCTTVLYCTRTARCTVQQYCCGTALSSDISYADVFHTVLLCSCTAVQYCCTVVLYCTELQCIA